MIQYFKLDFSQGIALPVFPKSVKWARLTFSGVTAPVKIYCGETLLLEAENYFRTYSQLLDVTKVSGQTLSFIFEDLKDFTQKRSAQWQTPLDENGFVYTHGYRYPFIRQPAYACGWDWCHPIFPRATIQSIVLSIQTEEPFVFHGLFETVDIDVENIIFELPYTLSNDLLTATISPQISFHALVDDEFEIVLEIDSQIFCSKQSFIPPFDLKQIKLWSPNTFGQPNLYTAVLTLKNIRTQQVYVVEKTVGFKSIKIDADPHLRFEVNGTDFPVRGANFIPTHIHGEKEDFEKLKKLISLAHESGFNTLRVWGGGSYATEMFYTLCDAYGILVWQDFPFACNLYPENEQLQKEIELEVDEQIKRLRQHVSLGVWCGNNEVHSAFYEWLAYANLPYFEGQIYFHELLPKKCALLSPNIPYWAGSPWDPKNIQTPNSSTAGDRHAWQCYFGDEVAKTDYRFLAQDPSMFISEMGFVAPPNYASIPIHLRSFEALDAVSNYGIPIARLLTYMAQALPIDDPLDLQTFCEQGQEAQAQMLDFVLKAWCARGIHGILLWHFNDLSVACSWGLVDGAMRPRKSLDVVRKIFLQEKI